MFPVTWQATFSVKGPNHDSSSDTMTGSDWFFAGTADKITDLNKIDQAFIFGMRRAAAKA
jgi:hypothetical protein